jgi:ABC-type glycerol-3-phosphate transport system substrate-binding protein
MPATGDTSLVLDGMDVNYEAAQRLGRLFVTFTATGHPLRSRVARNMATIEEIIAAYNESNPGNEIVLQDLPSYDAVMEKGIGSFLRPPN